MMVSRRSLLVSGGVGVGLVIAWAGWPRGYAANLTASAGETIFGAWLKIGRDGQVIVAVPQTEHGQGVYTSLPQIVADELGADWRSVGVEAAPLNPLYANPLGATEMFGDLLPPAIAHEQARRATVMLTAGSTSVRMFEGALRDAGAAARVLLCQAAAARWGVDWQACATAGGFVTHGDRRMRFADLAEAAAAGTLPDPLPYRSEAQARLTGQSLPRLDAPAKVDGSANFAGDLRLADMVFASICAGPSPDSRLIRSDKAAADRVPGVIQVVEADQWVAAVGVTWWAANRGVAALAPRFATPGRLADTAAIEDALDAALDGDGIRMASAGDLGAAFRGAQVVTASYRAAPAIHAAIETPAATAYWHNDRLELWLPTDAPGLARAAAARAIRIDAGRVTVHPMLTGGSFGEALEHDVAVQAATLAVALKRPVQVVRSRGEAQRQDRVRAPAAARMTARLAPDGRILGWLAKIAAPATGRELATRLMPGDPVIRAASALPRGGDAYAVDGALPPYRLPAYAIDHHPAAIGVATGHLRGGAHGYTCFFTECFIDELAHVAGTEALSFRIALLGGVPRLARCLSTVAALGGWDGGVPGSGQGIACHRFRGSHIAVLAEVSGDGARIRVDRLVAAVDCGRQINPDLVRQQIEGGLIFGMAAALGAATGYKRGITDASGYDGLRLPLLADLPEITVELVASDEPPGGVGELGVPAVAPAIANALRAASGQRARHLPLRIAA